MHRLCNQVVPACKQGVRRLGTHAHGGVAQGKGCCGLDAPSIDDPRETTVLCGLDFSPAVADRLDLLARYAGREGKDHFDRLARGEVEGQEQVVVYVEIRRYGVRAGGFEGAIDAVDAKGPDLGVLLADANKIRVSSKREDSVDSHRSTGALACRVAVIEGEVAPHVEGRPDGFGDGVDVDALGIQARRRTCSIGWEGDFVQLDLHAFERCAIGDVCASQVLGDGLVKKLGIMGGDDSRLRMGVGAVDGPATLLVFRRAGFMDFNDGDSLLGEFLSIALKLFEVARPVARAIPEV